jgi:hypothetical protein
VSGGGYAHLRMTIGTPDGLPSLIVGLRPPARAPHAVQLGNEMFVGLELIKGIRLPKTGREV